MKATLVFSCFLYLVPILTMGMQVGNYPLTADSILNKTYLGNTLKDRFDDIMSDELFYTDVYGSARPTCAGTFLRNDSYLYFNTGDFAGDILSFSFWFYPGDAKEGYVWTLTDDFYNGTAFYVLYNDNNLEFGAAKWNETDDKAITVKGYKEDQWYLLIITLENNANANKTLFKTYDSRNLADPIADLVFPARANLSKIWVNLGNYNRFAGGFLGFVYQLNVWDSLLDSKTMESLFSTSCTGECSQCPIAAEGDNVCLDLDCLYPVGAHEFDPILLCDSSCDAYCQGPSKGGAAKNTPDSSCSECMTSNVKADSQGNCNCDEGQGHMFSRGQLSGCSNCGDGCTTCSTSEHGPTCDACADPAAHALENGCKCPKDYEITDKSLGFCVMICAKECASCADGEPTHCNSCSYQLATAEGGICQCQLGYFATNSTDETLSCSPCNSSCSDCEGAADYCIECSGEGTAAFDGRCVCDHGYYPSYAILNGTSVPTCTRKDYLACSDSCDKCDKNCFMCTDINNSDGSDNCFTSSLGYQMKFRRGIITVTFSQDLDKPLDKYDFNVQDKEGTWHDASYWSISMVSPSEYKIFTDLTKDDLPVQVFFTFAKVDNTKPTPDL